MPGHDMYQPKLENSFLSIKEKADECYNLPQEDAERAKAYSLYLQAAALNPCDEWVLNRVGCCYEFGVGTENNNDEAVFWYELAARHGSDLAMGSLKDLYIEKYGNDGSKKYISLVTEVAEKGFGSAKVRLYDCYINGESVEQDRDKAFQYLDDAIAENYLPAVREKGYLYYFGDKGIEKNQSEAVRLWEIAANQGDGSATYLLGLCYEDGSGVDSDYEKAREYFKLAMERGSADAAVKMGRFYESDDGNSDFLKAYECYQTAADKGSAEAYFKLGYLYYSGKGVKHDLEKAFECWKAGGSVDEKNEYVAGCALDVGLCYRDGTGIEKDGTQAIKWFEKARDLGNITALLELGKTHDDGGVSELDYEKARDLYQQALDGGVINAAVWLGGLYLNGHGVQEDQERALSLYKKAAEQDDTAGLMSLFFCYYHGKGTAPDYDLAVECLEKASRLGETKADAVLNALLTSPEEISKNPQKAFEHNLKRAEQGDVEAEFQVYRAYCEGIGVEKDETLADSWCEKAADHGDARAAAIMGIRCLGKDNQKTVKYWEYASKKGNAVAMFELASIYQNGFHEIEVDKKRACAWFEIAADLGNNKARLALAQILATGDGVPKDLKRAQALYQMIINERDPEVTESARFNLALLYHLEFKDYQNSFPLWQELAKEGNAAAQYNLGQCYYFGQGTEKNISQASYWWREAAERGNEDAQKNLDVLEGRA